MSSQARRGAIFHYTNLLLIMVAGVFVTPFIVQKLGGSQYGLYSLMGGIIPCLALLDMGMSQTVNRYIAYYRAEENRDDESRFIATAMRIYGVIVAMIVATGVLVVSHIDRIWGSDFTRSELNDLRLIRPILVGMLPKPIYHYLHRRPWLRFTPAEFEQMYTQEQGDMSYTSPSLQP